MRHATARRARSSFSSPVSGSVGYSSPSQPGGKAAHHRLLPCHSFVHTHPSGIASAIASRVSSVGCRVHPPKKCDARQPLSVSAPQMKHGRFWASNQSRHCSNVISLILLYSILFNLKIYSFFYNITIIFIYFNTNKITFILCRHDTSRAASTHGIKN